MTVQELIEFLQKCEPDYEVKVYEYDGDKGHYGPLCIDVGLCLPGEDVS